MSEHKNYYVDGVNWSQKIVDSYLESKSKDPLLITDIDDTVLDSNLRWYEHYLFLLRVKKVTPSFNQAVTLAEFKKRGPRRYFEEVVSNYDFIKNALIHNITFNSGLRGVPTIEWLTRVNQEYNLPHGYITTRPASLGEQTDENLKNYFQSVAPILLRSGAYIYQDTIEYKFRSLLGLRESMNDAGFSSRTIYYVDDYGELIDRVNRSDIAGLEGRHFTETSSWKEVINMLGISID